MAVTRREQARAQRGFFGIGIERCKTETNVGTLWRGGINFDAAFMFTIAHRYRRQCSDTVHSSRHMPYFHFTDVTDWREHIPHDCVPVGVELCEGAVPLETYTHPTRAVYLLGPEDGSLSDAAREVCRNVVYIDSRYCLNVAMAGTIVMYDRATKQRKIGSGSSVLAEHAIETRGVVGSSPTRTTECVA